MNTEPEVWAEVDEQGRVVLPPTVAARYGLTPGARVRIEEDSNKVLLRRPVSQLARVYIEATNRCNIACCTCMRNDWDADQGLMTEATFERIMAGLRTVAPAPSVFFGGLGEPLAHPHTPAMIARAKSLGATVELITNGTLLTEKRAQQLIGAGLDLLWVSIDGATPASYADVRLGAELPRVLANLDGFRKARPASHRPRPEIGIVFVAMKRNIADLPEVIAMGRRLGATRFMVTNLLPYSRAMCDETLYDRTLKDITYMPSAWVPKLHLPKMEFNDLTREPLFQALASGCNVSFVGNNLGAANDTCAFIESGSLTIGWDGSVSPCIPLLYNHTSYVRGQRRVSHRHIIGNVGERDLLDLWHDPAYLAHRERVQNFSFSPCASCGGCDLSTANQTDCSNNEFPTCGGCLWAQGAIQCP